MVTDNFNSMVPGPSQLVAGPVVSSWFLTPGFGLVTILLASVPPILYWFGSALVELPLGHLDSVPGHLM